MYSPFLWSMLPLVSTKRKYTAVMQTLLLLLSNSNAGLLLMLNVGCRELEDLFSNLPLEEFCPKRPLTSMKGEEKLQQGKSRHHTRPGTKCPKEGHLI